MNKISIAGNCQVVPLVNFLKTALPEIELIYLPIYTCSSSDVIDFHRHVSSSDIVINTLTTESYRDNIGLGSDYLKSLMPPNSLNLIIPCVYYTGYFPTTSSFKNEDSLIYNYCENTFQKSKYHDYIPIVLAKHNIQNIAYSDIENKLSQHSEVARIIDANHLKSIAELQKKEQLCDISISEDIIRYYQTERCFLTFNHPSRTILIQLYNKIIQRINSVFNLSISYCNYDTCGTLNASDKILIYNFILKHLKCNYHHSHLDNINILNTIIKYYIENPLFVESEINHQAYKNSYELLKLSGIL